VRIKKHWAAPLLTSLIITPAFAESDLNINGFLSVGASMLDDNKASIAGADNNGGFKQDTVLGLQVQKQVNDSTSATGQLVSRGSDDYSTEAAWAFVTYAANDDLDLRMGRLRIPFFQYSDFLEVGYAYNWIRTPSDVYRVPFSSLDGVDLTQRFSSGNLDGSVQVYYGRFQGDFDTGIDVYAADFRNFTGLAISANMGNFGTRLSYHQAEIILDASDPTTALGAASAGAAQIATGLGDPSAAEDFSFNGQTSQFIEAALTYDDGTYSAVAEWTALDHESSIFLDDEAWLISVAARFDEFTPHLTYSTEKDSFDSGSEGAIQEILPLKSEQTSITLGLRYDYDSSTALKFEVQNNDEKTTAGIDGDSATLYSIAVDIVF
jgi:predicted porin